MRARVIRGVSSDDSAPRRSARSRTAETTQRLKEMARKRIADDSDEEEEYDEVEEEEVESGDEEMNNEQDSEEEVIATPRKSPARKRQRQAAAAAPRAAKAPRRAAAAARPSSASSTASSNDLFEALKSAEMAVQELARGWADKFREQPNEAMLSAVNLVLRAASIEHDIPAESLQADNLVTVIETLLESLAETTHDYALMNKKTLKHLRANYIDFWRAVSEQLGADVHEATLLVDWLVALSSAPLRSLRHAGTVASLCFVTGCCNLSTAVRDELNTLGDANRRKSVAAKERGDVLERRLAEIEKLTNSVTSGYAENHEYYFANTLLSQRVCAPLPRHCAGHPRRLYP